MFLDPADVLKNLPTRAEMRVGDFGAGTGVYSFALAEKFPDGSVYAFEMLPQHIDAMGRKNIRNLFPLIADLNRHIPLRDSLLDAGIVANTLHALSDRERFVSELGRVLGRRAPALVIDWAASFGNMGPREEDVLSAGDAVRLFESAGFMAGPMLPAGSHHYAFLATRA